jgi:hypothetical protein
VAALFSLQANAQAASIRGEVNFVGNLLPERPLIRVTKDQDYCGVTLPDEGFLVGSSRGLKNVVVHVEESSTQPARKGNVKENVLENRGCRFVPRVMAMRWGERLLIKNSDLKLHIVHAYADKRTVFNLSLPFRGQSLEITQKIKKPALLHINCDTHNWMRGYIHVFGHPFFAVTDERGFFSVADIPAGRYSLKAWHEEAGVQSTEIVVPVQGEIKVQFEFGKKSLQ